MNLHIEPFPQPAILANRQQSGHRVHHKIGHSLAARFKDLEFLYRGTQFSYTRIVGTPCVAGSFLGQLCAVGLCLPFDIRLSKEVK